MTDCAEEVAGNHLNEKEAQVTVTSSGFRPSPMSEQPARHLAASLTRERGGPRSPQPRSPLLGQRGVPGPGMLSGCTCFLLPRRAAHLQGFQHLASHLPGGSPKLGGSLALSQPGEGSSDSVPGPAETRRRVLECRRPSRTATRVPLELSRTPISSRLHPFRAGGCQACAFLWRTPSIITCRDVYSSCTCTGA